MPDKQPQTLTFPLTITATGSIATVDQDSQADIASCVTSILATPPGWRIDDPTFGRPPQLNFRQGGVDVDQITQTLARLEPRATPAIVAGVIAGGRQDVQIDMTGGRA